MTRTTLSELLRKAVALKELIASCTPESSMVCGSSIGLAAVEIRGLIWSLILEGQFPLLGEEN